MSTRRWPEIDALYAIGTVLVVFGHSHSSDWSTFSGTILNPVITFIYIFHMPLFFFISGFLFMNSDSLEKMGYGQWLKKKAERLLTPYVVLSIAALIPKYYVENQGFNDFTVGYLVKTVFVPRIGVWGHFWFLPVLMLIYLLFGLERVCVTNKRQKIFVEGTAVIAVILYFLPYSTEWLGFGDFKEAIIYFALGISLNRHMRTLQNTVSAIIRILWILVGTVSSITLFQYFYKAKAAMLITAIIMISVSWQAAVLIGKNSVCRWLSSNNLTIYIYSWPFQAIMMAIAGRLDFSWYLTSLSMFVAGITAPIFLVVVYKKLKVLNNQFFNLLIGIK